MVARKWSSLCVGVIFVCAACGHQLMGAEPAPNTSRAASGSEIGVKPPAASAAKHPLLPVLAVAQRALERLNHDVHDYSCVIIKRERVAGKLGGYQKMRAKIRHREIRSDGQTTPFGVYLNFAAPASAKGREVLYVEGERNGDMLVRRGGARMPNMTLQIDPNGKLAMKESRYPITDIGIKNLVEKIHTVLEDEIKFAECQVRFLEDARVNGRVCTHIEVVHPIRRSHFNYHIARVFIDRELQVPIYFASYDWPQTDGGTPDLLEEYAYTQLKVNCALTDRDFSSANESYGFRNLPPKPEADATRTLSTSATDAPRATQRVESHRT